MGGTENLKEQQIAKKRLTKFKKNDTFTPFLQVLWYVKYMLLIFVMFSHVSFMKEESDVVTISNVF